MQFVKRDGEGSQRAAWQPASQLPPALALRQLIFGHRVARIITVAAQLGLADAMDETPRSLADLASAISADAAALQIAASWSAATSLPTCRQAAISTCCRAS